MGKTPPILPLSLFFQGKTQELLEFHRKGVDLNTVSDIGEIDWFNLLYHHHYACFLSLLEHNAVNVHATEQSGHTAIHGLVLSLQLMRQTLHPQHLGVKALEALLTRGISLETQEKGQTVLEGCLHMERVYRQNTSFLLRWLVEHGAVITPKAAKGLTVETLSELEQLQLRQLSLDPEAASLRLKRL